MFLLISGTLNINEKHDFKKMYRKALLILLQILFWGGIYSIWSTTINPNITLAGIISYFLEGNGSMWYLWLTIGLYMITPWIFEFFKQVGFDLKLLIIFLGILVVFPSMYNVLSVVFDSNSSSLVSSILMSVKNDYNNLMISQISIYLVYYYLGKLLFENKEKIKKFRVISNTYFLLFMFTLGGGISFFVTEIVTSLSGNMFLYYGNDTIGVFLQAISIYLLFILHEPNTKTNKEKDVICLLADNSYGVFLIHNIAIEIVKFPMGINILDHQACKIPLITIAVFVFCQCFVALCRKVPMFRVLLS